MVIVTDKGPALPEQRTTFGQLIGRHSMRVARLIMSMPTKLQPGAPPEAPENFPDVEFVSIEDVEIIEHPAGKR